MGFAGVVVFARAIGLGARDGHGVCGVHDFRDDGDGEHYLVNLVVAFPFAVFLQGLCALGLPWNDRARVTAFGHGLLSTLGWIGALCFAVKSFWILPVLPWTCCVLTVASAIFVQRRREAATDRCKICEPAPPSAVPVAVF
jgi:hypothetical protein